MCDDIGSLRVAVTLVDATFVQWGLTISTQKTTVLVGKAAAEQSAHAVITIRGEVLEVVSHFKYLGSTFASDGMVDTEIAHRVASASSAFARLHQAKVGTQSGAFCQLKPGVIALLPAIDIRATASLCTTQGFDDQLFHELKEQCKGMQTIRLLARLGCGTCTADADAAV